MNPIHRFVILLAAATALASCKPGPQSPDSTSADQAAADEVQTAAAAAPASALIEACKLKMTQPEAHEWTTYWDPAHTRTASQNPSGVDSFHWANADEQKVRRDGGTAIPLDLVCGSDEDVAPTVKFDITAFDSRPTDIPLGPGTYVIAKKASPARNKPGEFIVGVFLFDKSMFAANSGTLTIDRFDMEGIAGSFTIDGNEILMGSRPLHLEGTFDMPCRKGLLQSACASAKAEQPH
jgi:hypothetical protein